MFLTLRHRGTARGLALAALAIAIATAAPTRLEGATMLPPCPDRPNCVSSQAVQPARRIAPIAYAGPPEAAQQRLQALIEQHPRARVIESRPGWIAAEYRSRLFGFVDDLQLELDTAAGVFHVRSASRTGYWDLGVNRSRVEALREAFRQAG